MAMFIALVVLLLLTIIILHSARSSTLEVMISNNTQNTTRAFMRAEDSIVAGEQRIELDYSGAPKADFSENTDDGLYVVGDIDIKSVDWSKFAVERVGEGQNYREYVIEYLGPTTATGGSLSVGAGVASDTRYLYRVSGRGESPRGGARVVQTIYATAE